MFDAIDAKDELATNGKNAHKFDDLAKAYIEHVSGKGQFPLFTGGRFYLYDGTRYRAVENLNHEVRQFFKETKRGQSNNVVGNVVPIVESYAYRSSAEFGSMPFYVGTDTFPKTVIPFRNGLLDVASLMGSEPKLLPHTPKFCSTFCLPFDFNAQAECPKWMKFLTEVFEGDESRIALLQEWFGYCLSGSTSRQKALLQIGKKRSGKGTTQFVLQSLLGGENWTAYSLDLLVTAFGFGPLVGKGAAFVGEVELSGSKDRNVILERLKSIIGEDPQIINEKFNPVQRSVKIPARFVVACNTMPNLFDPSGAIGSRFLFLPYEKSFAGRENENLKAELEAELPGIANWALAGLVRLNAMGKFSTADAHAKMLADFERSSSPVQCFVGEKCLVRRSIDPGDLPESCLSDRVDWVAKADLFFAYEEWCEEYGISTTNQVYFSRDLKTVLPKLTMGQRRAVGGSFVKVYNGIALRPEPPAEPKPTTTATTTTTTTTTNDDEVLSDEEAARFFSEL